MYQRSMLWPGEMLKPGGFTPNGRSKFLEKKNHKKTKQNRILAWKMMAYITWLNCNKGGQGELWVISPGVL